MAQTRILFAASEAAPLAKVGGMGDVVGTLPAVLRKMGLDVRIIMPFYGFLWDQIDRSEKPLWTKNIMSQDADIFETVLPGTDVPVYLVSHYSFAPQRVYYGEDEFWRFIFFANTVAEFAWTYPWRPNIIHCHDWHTGMIPAWMHQSSDIGTVFTIHNLAYQGPWRWQLERMMTWIPWYFEAQNAMAAGIMYADQVNTVSPTYANEIRTPEHGEKLEGFLAAKGDRLRGILNGIDRQQFDPATDSFLKHTFTAETLDYRAVNKEALQVEAGLIPNPETFLLGMVVRLVEQKGIDLILQVMDRFLAYSDAQFFLLGSGEAYYEGRIRELSDRYPGRMSFQQKYDPGLSQLVYGGADAFLMPSRFEPCGISQMIALRYGCVPIVRRTGGLVDTVSHHVPSQGTGTGYCFDRYEGLDFYTCVVRAWEGFQHKETWRKLQQRGMAVNLSWDRSAVEYIHMYESILNLPLLPT